MGAASDGVVGEDYLHLHGTVGTATASKVFSSHVLLERGTSGLSVYNCTDTLTSDQCTILAHLHMLIAFYSHLKRKIYLHKEGQYLPMGYLKSLLPCSTTRLSMRNHEQSIRNQTCNHNHNTVYSHSKA